MYRLKEFLALLEECAPLSLSRKLVDRGDYDNSGIILNIHDQVKNVLFTLDLSAVSVKKAVELGCDTVVTHHPAIYNPVKSLDRNGDTAAVLAAARAGLNVISMHLNLDVAKGGIDDCLSLGLGGTNIRVIDVVDGECGYGKESKVGAVQVEEFVEKAKTTFRSDKIIGYGSGKVNKIASFCGGGASHALDAVTSGATDADTVITSDVPHHVLSALVEAGKNVIIIQHYVSEEYGFNKFYARISSMIKDGAHAYYFADKRFM